MIYLRLARTRAVLRCYSPYLTPTTAIEYKNKMRPIVVVSYSSLERPFIEAILTESLKFAKRIVVAYSNLLYNGGDEDIIGIARLATTIGHCSIDCPISFVPYHVGREELAEPIPLHNRARMVGLRASQPEPTDWVLFLDGDEVPDGDRFAAFLANIDADGSIGYKLANYWYFLTPRLRATEKEDSILMVHMSWLEPAEAMYHPRERDGIIIYNMTAASAGEVGKRDVMRNVMGADGLPMFHHYSWVRSHGNLLAKVQGWGHRGQRDWEALLGDAWIALHNNFNIERDFVHGYPLEKCDVFPGIKEEFLE
jgi:glycosyltransferase involved in cell wall biosynthesis